MERDDIDKGGSYPKGYIDESRDYIREMQRLIEYIEQLPKEQQELVLKSIHGSKQGSDT